MTFRRRRAAPSRARAPSSPGRIVIVTERGHTAYKRSLEPGDPVRIQRVKGDPAHSGRRLPFVAAGTGIAPLISIIRELNHLDKVDDVTMTYVSRTRPGALLRRDRPTRGCGARTGARGPVVICSTPPTPASPSIRSSE